MTLLLAWLYGWGVLMVLDYFLSNAPTDPARQCLTCYILTALHWPVTVPFSFCVWLVRQLRESC